MDGTAQKGGEEKEVFGLHDSEELWKVLTDLALERSELKRSL